MLHPPADFALAIRRDFAVEPVRLPVRHCERIAKRERWYDQYRKQRSDKVKLKECWVKPVSNSPKIAITGYSSRRRSVEKADPSPRCEKKKNWYEKYQ